jgi:hypothetical protein
MNKLTLHRAIAGEWLAGDRAFPGTQGLALRCLHT